MYLLTNRQVNNQDMTTLLWCLCNIIAQSGLMSDNFQQSMGNVIRWFHVLVSITMMINKIIANNMYPWQTPVHTERQLIHYNDVIMNAMASQITSLTSIYSIVYSGTDQRKHQSSVSLAFVRGIHRWAVNFPHHAKASNAENVSIWWRHHERDWDGGQGWR